jgi:hypothetical protein
VRYASSASPFVDDASTAQEDRPSRFHPIGEPCVSPIRKTSLYRWGAPSAAFAAGLMLGHLPAGSLAGAAPATTPVSPFERLVAEDDIRQKIALYGLYADGDGADGRPRDLKTLAYDLMTPDVVSEIHTAQGGPPKVLAGRDVVAKSPPENDPELAHRVAGRHYLFSTVFDDVSATTAHTRTASVYFDATKNTGGVDCAKTNDCAGKPVKTIMWVYQMTWRKTPEGWQIARNVLRDDN